MKNSTTNIADIIAEIARRELQTEIYSVVGKVKEVNEAERTCTVTPIGVDVDIFGVRLQASINKQDKGIVVFPVVGSDVVVTFLNKQTGFVSATSKVDSYIVETQGESLKDILNDMLDAITQITTTTAIGTQPILNIPAFTAIKTRLNLLLKQ